ncbi:MAG: Cna B-type domain-containing protein [Oscillospiraceae bacterium]|nr:Cna B-type domain-containing protein [Oscillospiraceae bacterium]
MKQTMKGRKIISLLLTAMLLVGLLPFGIIAGAAVPGEGDIPIPAEAFKTDSNGEETANPEKLEEGQIWVNKNVVDMGAGEFEITLYVWGAPFIENGSSEKPLVADDEGIANVDITDVIGDWFSYNADADYEVGEFNHDNGVVTWIVSQDDILDDIQSCTFTVSLKEHWVVETPYETNKAATATFKPKMSNPYYWTEREEIPVEFEISGLNWSDKAMNNANLKDVELIGPNEIYVGFRNSEGPIMINGLSFARHSSNNNPTYPPVGFAGRYYGYYIVDAPADVLQEYNKAKVYTIWFTGLEGDNVLTEYIITVTNPGGSEPGIIKSVRAIEYTQPTQRSRFKWLEGDIVEENMPNSGIIEIHYKTVIVDSIDITVNKAINKSEYTDIPDGVTFWFYLKDDKGNDVGNSPQTIKSEDYKDGKSSITLTIPSNEYGNISETREYKITESVTGADENWINDTHTFNVVVSTGGFTIDGQKNNSVKYTNAYTFVPTGKLVVKKDWGSVEEADQEPIDFTLSKEGDTGFAMNGTLTGDSPVPWEWEIEGLELGATYYVNEGVLSNGALANMKNSGSVVLDGSNIGQAAVITLTNGYIPGRGSITVIKEWVDAEYDEGTLPTVYVTIQKNDDTSFSKTQKITLTDGVWSTIFSALEMGTYTVSEGDVAGYELDGSNDRVVTLSDVNGDISRNTSITLKNVYSPVAKLTINKTWVGNYSETTPPSIGVEIYKLNDQDEWMKYGETITLSANSENLWTWTGEVEYGTYKVEELLGEYADVYTVNGTGDDHRVTLDKEVPENGFDIVNTDVVLGKITITKEWATKYGDLIPDSLTVTLTSTDGDTYESSEYIVNADGNWEYVFENLPLKEYVISEDSIHPNFNLFSQDVPSLVKLSPTERTANATIVNSYAINSGMITVKKEWEGVYDPQRPSSVSVTLSGVYVGSIDNEGLDIDDEEYVEIPTFETITKQMHGRSWSYTFYDLPLDFEYTVTESPVEYYDTSYKDNINVVTLTDDTPASTSAVITVINDFTNPKGTLIVNKEYIGAHKPAGGGDFPGTVSFYLIKNGVVVSYSEALAEGYGAAGEDANGRAVFETNNGSITINNLPLGYPRANVYTVRESTSELGEGYSLFNNGGKAQMTRTSQTGAITITNSYSIPTGDLKVKKIWEDTGFEFARPADGITITLYRHTLDHSDRFVNSIVLNGNEEDPWTGVFEKLPLYDNNGNMYTYSLSESGINTTYYDFTYDGSFNLVKNEEKTVEVTNTANSATIKGRVTVNKVWVGTDEDSPFPEDLIKSVTVRLLADGRLTHYWATLSDRNWSASWRVPVTDNEGNRIKYTVMEVTESEHWKYDITSSEEDFKINGADGKLVLTLTNEYIPFEGDIKLDKEGKDVILIEDEEGIDSAIIPYTLVITNQGNKSLENIEVTDTLDAGMTFVEGSLDKATLKSNTDGELVFIIDGTLAPKGHEGDSITVTYKVMVSKEGDYENKAVVKAKVVGEDETVDDDTKTESNVAKPVLGIEKSVSQPSITSSGTATYTFTLKVYNQGDVDLYDVEITDKMVGPNENAKMTYSYDGDYGFIEGEDGEVIFTIGTLGAGKSSDDIVYTVTVDTAGDYNNTATVIGWFNDADGEHSLTHNGSAKVTLSRPSTPPPTPRPDPDPDPTPEPEPDPEVETYIDEDYTIVDQEVPLLQLPPMQVPLADLPPDPEEFLEVIDPDTPLSNLPQTGSQQIIPIAAFGLGAAALGGGLLINRKKKEDDII